MAGAFSIHFWEPVMALFFRYGGAGGQCGGSGREERHERVPGDDECCAGGYRETVRGNYEMLRDGPEGCGAAGGASRRIFRYLRSG